MVLYSAHLKIVITVHAMVAATARYTKSYCCRGEHVSKCKQGHSDMRFNSATRYLPLQDRPQ